MDDVQIIVYWDCTKLGVMSQPEINQMGDFVEKHLCRNPYGFLGTSYQQQFENLYPNCLLIWSFLKTTICSNMFIWQIDLSTTEALWL